MPGALTGVLLMCADRDQDRAVNIGAKHGQGSSAAPSSVPSAAYTRDQASSGPS